MEKRLGQLKRERQADAGIVEIPGQFPFQRQHGTQRGQQLHHRPGEHIGQTLEWLLQYWAKETHFAPIVSHEALELISIARAHPGDLLAHPG